MKDFTNGKVRIINDTGKLEIIVPAKKNWSILIFGIIWLVMWPVLFFLPFDVDRSIGLSLYFSVFWLIVLFVLLWGFFGKETFTIENQKVFFYKTVFGIGIKKVFNKTYVSHLLCKIK